MLRQLEPRELAGVLAHEVSHVRNNDPWVMGLADVTSRITGWFSMLGQILFLLNIPLVLMGAVSISWLAIALLIFAPTLSGLIQLALSRTREYDADIGAVELTGDPRGLASALAKLERTQGRWLEQILMPGRRVPDPSLLRTHPPTAERIERLLALTSDHATTSRPRLATTPHHLSTIPVVTSRPRWRGVMGVWS